MLFFFLDPTSGMQDLSSLTSDQTHSPCSGSAESYARDHQGHPLEPLKESGGWDSIQDSMLAYRNLTVPRSVSYCGPPGKQSKHQLFEETGSKWPWSSPRSQFHSAETHTDEKVMLSQHGWCNYLLVTKFTVAILSHRRQSKVQLSWYVDMWKTPV